MKRLLVKIYVEMRDNQYGSDDAEYMLSELKKFVEEKNNNLVFANFSVEEVI